MKRLASVVVAAVLLAAAPAHAALKVGSRGTAVKAVQQRLGLPADGVYGRATALAVRRFQRRHDLTVTGRVNAETKAVLPPSPSNMPLPKCRPVIVTLRGGRKV